MSSSVLSVSSEAEVPVLPLLATVAALLMARGAALAVAPPASHACVRDALVADGDAALVTLDMVKFPVFLIRPWLPIFFFILMRLRPLVLALALVRRLLQIEYSISDAGHCVYEPASSRRVAAAQAQV